MAVKKGFEDSLKQLEKAVVALEGGELSLEQALKTFEAGVKSVTDCRQSLEKVELQVEKLMQQEDGSFSREPFDE